MQNNWFSELAEYYKQGKLTKDQITELIGPDIAQAFFEPDEKDKAYIIKLIGPDEARKFFLLMGLEPIERSDT